MIRKFWYYFKQPLIYFSIALLVGGIVGFLINPMFEHTNIADTSKLILMAQKKLFKIFSGNVFIIFCVYISIVFTNKYAYFTYILNGCLLGIILSWILQTNLMLFMLILPHGILEIPCILGTGYILKKGKKFIEENFNKYIMILAFHVLFVFISAFIESYITPVIFSSCA